MVEIACSTGEPWERQEMPSGIYLKELLANESRRFQHKQAWSRKGSEFPHCLWSKDQEKNWKLVVPKRSRLDGKCQKNSPTSPAWFMPKGFWGSTDKSP